MSEIAVFFAPEYCPPSHPALQRLGLAAQLVVRRKLGHLRAPRPLEYERLRGLHCDRYLEAFFAGDEPLASSQGVPWSAALRDATLCMLGGQLEGAQHALDTGIAMNLARGFHHAVYERGSGFCALNGIALVAHAMPGKRIAVLDCDEHGGNGTAEYAARLENLYALSIFGTRFGCYSGLRSYTFPVRVRENGFGQYLNALQESVEIIAKVKPDLLIYQAGVDCHDGDPKSQVGLSTRDVFQRDLFVFKAARALGIPILFLVGGGYQRAWRVAQLNANTLAAALAAARPGAAPPPLLPE
ncbi:MAG: hypothetical protein JNN30_10220 [Rhodanobacteraceae bacterium]|nr:hypothetical protein [Rhodanobacteraceae bacterium]